MFPFTLKRDKSNLGKVPQFFSVLCLKARLITERPFLLASLLMPCLVVGVRFIGWLQPLELSSFDCLIRLQPELEPDPRLLVVGISESDIKQLQQWPISDQVLAEAIAILQEHNPQVIGLDIYRDIPQNREKCGANAQSMLFRLKS